jgi:hypothetical protein
VLEIEGIDSASLPAIGALLWGPHQRPVWCDGIRSTVATGKGADMTDKSPRKTASKKSGKSIKEKRQAKKDKQQNHKPLVRR